ncbi:hypothetical protein DICVIV_11225 [Dictyocaulus viviparus]|uniref:Uncharacterized protein n=1 Tax=Dictyocaulus viviparus TaxID=29172 RepID=A0A0D8XKE5_DICVI|nr:hypothetical protein DICVIV_11225 [Dictyocaulus viviparus]
MLILLLLLPLSAAQNPYGPSQLDQYARLINSGNLGGFGSFQHALAEGTARGFGDLNPFPSIAGLPPLPLTHEEVIKQLTSTPRTAPTRATAIPTTPSTYPGGIYAINRMVELPPMPENRIHGTFDDDGVFHPYNEKKTEQIIRNQIQGTKIRRFSQTGRDNTESNAQENTNKGFRHEDGTADDKVSLDAKEHQLTDRNKKSPKPRQNSTKDKQRLRHRQVKYYDSDAKLERGGTSDVPRQPRYPPFVFRPKPPPVQREPEYNNLLAEIEEYDDFLEEQRLYLSRYPKASVPNPYHELPPGQLPSAGAYSMINLGITLQNNQKHDESSNKAIIKLTNNVIRHYDIPPPKRISFENDNADSTQDWSLSPSSSQPSSTRVENVNPHIDNPLLNFFNLFSIPHAYAMAAPQLNIDTKASLTTTTTSPVYSMTLLLSMVE